MILQPYGQRTFTGYMIHRNGGQLGPASMEVAAKCKNIQFLTRHNEKVISNSEAIRSVEYQIPGGESEVTLIRFGTGKEASIAGLRTHFCVTENEMELMIGVDGQVRQGGYTNISVKEHTIQGHRGLMIENTSDDTITDVMIEATFTGGMKLIGQEEGATIIMLEDLYPGGSRLYMTCNFDANSSEASAFNFIGATV